MELFMRARKLRAEVNSDSTVEPVAAAQVTSTRPYSLKLQEVVVLQPHFVIKGISLVIRERGAQDVNDELRALDARIRGTTLERDLEDLLERGEVTQRLLTELWKHMSSRDRELVLELMTQFRLLRGLGASGSGMSERFVVPAMLPNSGLPDEYVKPEWWAPARAAESAAAVRVEPAAGESSTAAMRVMYEVVGGRLPYAFMTELQVSLSTSLVLQDLDNFSPEASPAGSPEASVVDRVAGSVLSEPYKCGDGSVTEWVVVSQRARSCRASAEASQMQRTDADSICVMAWAELIHPSTHGASDWRLLKRVMREIEELGRSMPTMYLRKLVLHVDEQDRCAKEEVRDGLHAKAFATFRFVDGSKKHVEVSSVLPQDGFETLLTVRLHKTRRAAGGPTNRVDAFFAKTVDDVGIDVHAEGQLITRAILNHDTQGWECTAHPQPTLQDLRTSMASAAARNTKVIHLAGHGGRKQGFLFNGDDAATASAAIDIHDLTAIIGGAAGANGSIECAVLNACSTEKMGQLLRTAGMSHVVCWRTSVHDETAREFCRHFYQALVEQTGNGSSPHRNYRGAFDAATAAMRVHAFTGGAARPPPETAAVYAGKGLRAGVEGDCAPGSRELDDVDLQSEQSDIELHATVTPLGESGSAAPTMRHKVFPWQEADVIQYLSVEGDSEAIYLWREQTRKG
jgi:hypothetical protein